MSAVFQLISQDDVFVSYFMNEKYAEEEANKKSKNLFSFLKMISGLFKSLWIAPGFQYYDKSLDIAHIQTRFSYQFSHERPHDAFRFLNHIFAGITKETLDSKVIKKWHEGKKDIYAL